MLIGAAKIEDFPPLSQQEFQHLATQIQDHLQKGVPPSAPVQGLPMDALCRLIQTIIVLGKQSEKALGMFKEIFDDLDDDVSITHNAIKIKLAPYVLQGTDLVDFLAKHGLSPISEESSDEEESSR